MKSQIVWASHNDDADNSVVLDWIPIVNVRMWILFGSIYVK